MTTVIVASNNAHKVEEIAHGLKTKSWRFLSLKEAGIVSHPQENATTFEANARIKAQSAFIAIQQAKIPVDAVIADDSGLEVAVLDGAPGVHSARYAGNDASDQQNNHKLLCALAQYPEEKRQARFVSVLVFLDRDRNEFVARGVAHGSIGTKPQGHHGFGYDPLFYPREYQGKKTFAQLSEEEKTRISHRGKALRHLACLLQEREY